jgi:hypothetical protein
LKFLTIFLGLLVVTCITVAVCSYGPTSVPAHCQGKHAAGTCKTGECTRCSSSNDLCCCITRDACTCDRPDATGCVRMEGAK